jgi:phosphotriesterase-related protein
MPKKIQTVCGELPNEQLGYCQMHEHVFVRPTPMSLKNPALTIDNETKSLDELLCYRQAGGVSLTDAQPLGAGRDAEALRRLSKNSGVHIIASTGYHLLGFYREDSPVLRYGEDELFELYRSELTDGMLAYDREMSGIRTDIRAGIIKAAIPKEGATGKYEIMLRAAARAALDFGCPLMLHTEAGENALAAVSLCLDLGLPAGNIVVCHADRQASDFAPHEELASAGVFLEYDTIGRFKYHSDEEEVALILHMLEKGCTSQLLLSLDTTAMRMAAYGGEISLCYLLDDFYPRLRACGLSTLAFKQLTEDNPRRVFCCA